MSDLYYSLRTHDVVENGTAEFMNDPIHYFNSLLLKKDVLFRFILDYLRNNVHMNADKIGAVLNQMDAVRHLEVKEQAESLRNALSLFIEDKEALRCLGNAYRETLVPEDIKYMKAGTIVEATIELGKRGFVDKLDEVKGVDYVMIPFVWEDDDIWMKKRNVKVTFFDVRDMVDWCDMNDPELTISAKEGEDFLLFKVFDEDNPMGKSVVFALKDKLPEIFKKHPEIKAEYEFNKQLKEGII